MRSSNIPNNFATFIWGILNTAGDKTQTFSSFSSPSSVCFTAASAPDSIAVDINWKLNSDHTVRQFKLNLVPRGS